MVRKFLYFIAFCIVVYLGGRLALQFYPEQLTRLSFHPRRQVRSPAARAASAYADPALWVARPGGTATRSDPLAARGLRRSRSAAGRGGVLHPPDELISKRPTGTPRPTTPMRAGSPKSSCATQASVFNRSADIWAPRYRQATFGAFVTDQPEARQALDLAYRDVAEAFDAFVAATPPGRPIVLAGHSQGSFHLKRLLAEKVKGTPLARRIVAAYAIGWLVETTADLPAMGLPACNTPDQTGCVISYLSYANEADTAMMRGAYARFAGAGGVTGSAARYLCSNPLTGGIGGAAAASTNQGATVPDLKFEKAQFTPGLVGAACAADGTLRIGEGPEMGPFVLPGGNYHVYDYALYWANLRADFARRVAAWTP